MPGTGHCKQSQAANPLTCFYIRCRSLLPRLCSALHNLVNLSWCKIGIFVVCNSWGGLFLALYEVQCKLGDQSNCQCCLDVEECPNMHSLSSQLLPSFSSSSTLPSFSSSYPQPPPTPPSPSHNLPLLHQHHRRHHHQHRPCERAIRSAA